MAEPRERQRPQSGHQVTAAREPGAGGVKTAPKANKSNEQSAPVRRFPPIGTQSFERLCTRLCSPWDRPRGDVNPRCASAQRTLAASPRISKAHFRTRFSAIPPHRHGSVDTAEILADRLDAQSGQGRQRGDRPGLADARLDDERAVLADD